MLKNYLCEFTVKKIHEISVTTDREIDGKKVQLIEKVATLDDVKYALLKPSRRITAGADIFYAKNVNELMSKGLMSVHMLSKRYDNDGGPYTDAETKRIEQIQLRKLQVSSIYFDNKLKSTTGQISKEEFADFEKTIFEELKGLQDELNEIQKPYLGIFNQTAEFKARNNTITWWLFALLLSYDDVKKEYIPFFASKDYENNLDKLEEIEESADEFTKAVVQKALFFISYWVGGGGIEKDSLASIESEFEGYTTYHPELEKDIKNMTPPQPVTPLPAQPEPAKVPNENTP